jgi:tetratricopeptide (TPR) repeat protein
VTAAARRGGAILRDVKLVATALLVATLAIGGARVAREAARAGAPEVIADEPYAPTRDAAPFVSLGYRELFADLLFVRLRGYFGGRDTTANGIAALVEAIVALDPGYRRIYEWGARAITLADRGVDNAAYLRALAVLEAGAQRFPDDWKLPYLAGEIYTQDLQTADPAQRRAWDERGTLLTEAAIRKPDAPAQSATWAATMRTRLGQRQRAIDGLREMLLVTNDDDARARLLDKLAELEQTTRSELAAELLDARRQFEAAWLATRPAVPASTYVLLGPALAPTFDLGDLATGGRDLIGAQPIERPDPLDDEPAVSSPVGSGSGPRSP